MSESEITRDDSTPAETRPGEQWVDDLVRWNANHESDGDQERWAENLSRWNANHQEEP